MSNDLIKAKCIVPILKKGKRSLASYYRPLSLTSVTSKILEHIICHHIWKHLEDHNVLSNFQHGFCKWRNCETQLTMAIDDLSDALQKLTVFWEFQSQHVFPSRVTRGRGDRVYITFTSRIFHVNRTKYRNTCKIYKKQLNEIYHDHINNLIETPSSDQPKKLCRFVKI